MVTYLFDSTFPGLLTAIFEAFAAGHKEVSLLPAATYQPSFLDTPVTILTDRAKAGRVWDGLGKRIGTSKQHDFYTVFLSEQTDAFQNMFDYTNYIFRHGGERALDYGNRHVLAIATYAKQVSRERHRMKAFVRFSKAADGLYLSVIEPDFNVLPLIAKHFADRYADQSWLIFDKRRHYGIYYDLSSVQEVRPDLSPSAATSAVMIQGEGISDPQDRLYTALWQEYFKSTNIKERNNFRLHVRHVPKRYWKYLPEKDFGV